jgi:hypothetical protein
VDDARSDRQIGKGRIEVSSAAASEEQELETVRQLAHATIADLTDVLTRQRQAIVDAAPTRAGLDPRLLAAAGHS